MINPIFNLLNHLPGIVSQELKQSRAREQADAESRKQELHKWKVLRAQAEVDHRILLNLNMQTPEHPITIGPDRIRTAEQSA